MIDSDACYRGDDVTAATVFHRGAVETGSGNAGGRRRGGGASGAAKLHLSERLSFYCRSVPNANPRTKDWKQQTDGAKKKEKEKNSGGVESTELQQAFFIFQKHGGLRLRQPSSHGYIF